jgi:type II pantothenate kinase
MQDAAARKGKGKDRGSISSHPLLRRSSVPPPLPGGLLNFERFETSNIDGLIEFIQDLISSSARANRVSEERMKSNVKLIATGGGAHMFYDRLKRDLGVEVLREEEMECLILGLGFIAHVPEEVFWFSEELVYKVSHPHEPRTIPASELPRPSPSPPSYQVTFAPTPQNAGEIVPVFPCLVVNIGSGVSIVKVDENGEFERVSGTSLGGGTLWGLLSMLTDARTFDGESHRSQEAAKVLIHRNARSFRSWR